MPRRPEHQWFLYDQQHDNAGDFLDSLRNLVKNAKVKINFLLVASQVDLKRELQSWLPEHFTVTAKNSLPVFSIEVEKEFEKRPPMNARAAIVRYREDLPVYLVVSDATSVVFMEVFTRLMNKHYPNIARIFLTNDEMREIFRKLEATTHTRISVDADIAKRRILGATRTRESNVKYTDKTFEEEFDDVESQGAWIQSIKFTARLVSEANIQTPEEKFSGIVSRGCFFSCEGDFEPFIRTIIPSSIGYASERYDYLKERAATAPESKPDPIVIKFKDHIFTDPRQNQQYIDALSQLESVSVSVYHSNPYMHLSMLDYLDGSSYDIWVISSDRMLIIPEFRASPASMYRLVNHVYERIHEGRVEPYAEAASAAQPQ